MFMRVLHAQVYRKRNVVRVTRQVRWGSYQDRGTLQLCCGPSLGFLQQLCCKVERSEVDCPGSLSGKRAASDSA